MRQLVYVMQFRGNAAPSSENPNVLHASTQAHSCNIHTVIDSEGINSGIEQVGGGIAAFESEVTLTGGTGFQESGNITFGDGGHRLHFSTVGEGYINASADDKLKHGAVTWKIDGGDGQFEGATGLINSNFTVSDTGEVVDNHFGVLFVR